MSFNYNDYSKDSCSSVTQTHGQSEIVANKCVIHLLAAT